MRAAADAWQPPLPAVAARRVRVIRDYGMADRREAPQFYPDVAATAAADGYDFPPDLSAEGDRP